VPRSNNNHNQNQNNAAVLNPLRHALSARTVAIPGLEDHGDWLNFREAIMQSLDLADALEHELGATIAECLWRRRRVARAEQQAVAVRRRRDELIFQNQLKPFFPPPARPAPSPGDPPLRPSFYAGAVAMSDMLGAVKPELFLPQEKELDRLIRYEAHINRQIYQALHNLEALQSRRRGEPAPLARVTVHGLPGT
jgi:hypothetical protein